MKIEQIFREFERALENEYYMELAKKEVMTVPLLIEVFLDDDYAKQKVLTVRTAILHGTHGKYL